MAIIVALIISVALLGVAAIVVDGGALYATKRNLQNSADAAALAGVQDLPGNTGGARTSASYYLDQNVREAMVGSPQIDILRTFGDNDTVRVTVVGGAPAAFSQMWGRGDSPVMASATAVVASPTGYSAGVMPFGIMSAEPSGTTPFGYAFNESVVLKQPSQQGESGNFQFLSLTDPPGGHDGGDDITGALRDGGVDNPVYLDTIYNTKTGMNGGNVPKALEQWVAADSHSFSDVAEIRPDGTVKITDWACPRLIICPIIVDAGPPLAYNWTEISGSKPVKVIGFSFFYIEDIGTNGKDCYITGRFIRPVAPEDAIHWGPIDPFGAVSFRLWQ